MFPRFDKLTVGHREANVRYLLAAGYDDPESACRELETLRSLSAEQPPGGFREDPAWYVTLERVLRDAPLRDRVLHSVTQFVANAIPHFDPFSLFGGTPRALEVLARIACGSPFLTQTLVADPDSLNTLIKGGGVSEVKSREQFSQEAFVAIEQYCSKEKSPADGHTPGGINPESLKRQRKLAALRRFHRRELLRISMCDLFGLMDLRFVTLQLSLLADAMVQVCLQLAAAECGADAQSMVVIALGKHGGEELNYSSDIDLILISDEEAGVTQKIARLTIDGLADNVSPGFLYRVDLRLRPWGDAGPLVSTIDAYCSYLQTDAALWEKQALLKARVVAGNSELGGEFLRRIRPLLLQEPESVIRTSIQQMKERIEQRLRQRGRLDVEVKLGIGSIRDVEFLVQYLQLAHGSAEPRILSFNTLDSLVRLTEFGLISPKWYRQLRAGYVFLRTVEHSLQLLHNQQTHELPAELPQREWLAYRLDYPGEETLFRRFNEHRTSIRNIFDECLRNVETEGMVGDNAALPPISSGGELLRTSPPEEGPDSGSASCTPDVVATPSTSVRAEQLLQRYQLSVEDLSSPAVFLQKSAKGAELVILGTATSGWLSVITGLIASRDLNILQGEAGIFESAANGESPVKDFFYFQMTVEPSGSFEAAGYKSFSETVNDPHAFANSLSSEIQSLFEQVENGNIQRVRNHLIERFCRTMTAAQNSVSVTGAAASKSGNTGLHLADMQIDVIPDDAAQETRLEISGTDTPGFLFEMSNALSISQFRIVRSIVASEGNQVRDTIDITEKDRTPVIRDERLEELRVFIALIKQFTHWLPTTSDPQKALIRFRELLARLQPSASSVQNIEAMRNPGVLHAIARVLGISQFLWEDFLRARHDELLPLLTNVAALNDRISREELSRQLNDEMNALYVQDPWQRLNTFKDRHLFRIDMRHVLGHCHPFGAFSEEITELAELVVERAFLIAGRQLEKEYGTPELIHSGREHCPYVVAGLGKCGGIEMGYASDIELLLIYHSDGTTNGVNQISTSRFFDLLINAVRSGISARQDGIFHVDLRMRPFGQAGSAAVSLRDFISYYGPNGPAWPYERQGLVKLRLLMGDREFSEEVIRTCHEVIYARDTFDFSAMRAMRERQIRQLVRGGSINAKLSDGGLVDLEYAVQAIQISFGKEIPELRHSNTLTALRRTARLGLIAPEQFSQIETAYVFLRELIDCLRMVRGNARDLTVPEPDSDDFLQLQRRMKSIHHTGFTLEALDTQMQAVRNFSHSVEQHCRAMRPARS
ncbi:MAG: glutamine synthetase adenylyltransferase [Planctomycetaceae bacterium]